jgi:hypothetical protein
MNKGYISTSKEQYEKTTPPCSHRECRSRFTPCGSRVVRRDQHRPAVCTSGVHRPADMCPGATGNYRAGPDRRGAAGLLCAARLLRASAPRGGLQPSGIRQALPASSASLSPLRLAHWHGGTTWKPISRLSDVEPERGASVLRSLSFGLKDFFKNSENQIAFQIRFCHRSPVSRLCRHS